MGIPKIIGSDGEPVATITTPTTNGWSFVAGSYDGTRTMHPPWWKFWAKPRVEPCRYTVSFYHKDTEDGGSYISCTQMAEEQPS